jgi:hypothetical protein
MTADNRLRRPAAAVLVTAGLAAFVAAAQPDPRAALPCSRDCLTATMSRFLADMVAHATSSIPVTPEAEIRENGNVVVIGGTAWKSVKAVRSVLTFADPLTGNVVSRAGVELDDGKAGYMSTRLKVLSGGRITDVEMSTDTSPSVVAAYVWNLDPELDTVLPRDVRTSRVRLEALARRYFHSLSSHEAVVTDFDARCNRFHSGQQITNVTSGTVEGRVARTCASALEGNPPWGPATEHRFPVIDEERGIVLGMTMLHYAALPNEQRMYVSEIFKVVDGRVVHIDNIGVMLNGIATLGFTH